VARLTKAICDKAAYTGKDNERVVLWDDETPGLGLRIYPSGQRAFVLSYRHQARKRLIALGRYGILTLDMARDRARKALAHVEESDPLAERQKVRLGENFADLAREYMERHAKPKKRSWREDARMIESFLQAPLGQRKLTDIRRADIASLHRRIGQTSPIAANRVLSLLSKMFALASRWDMLDENAVNPARGIDRYTETKRDRWITPTELPELAKAIDAEPNEMARHAIWLYLLTGARRSELLSAKWEDIDFDRRVLRLPKTKAGRAHEIPLSKAALTLLRQIPRAAGNPYVLAGRKAGRPLVNISKPWKRVRTAAKIEDVRLHDLRRTVGSWLATAGNSLTLIGKVLNHSSVSTTAIYARLGQDEARMALEQLGQRITAAAVPSKQEKPKSRRRA
jgi:integrase